MQLVKKSSSKAKGSVDGRVGDDGTIGAVASVTSAREKAARGYPGGLLGPRQPHGPVTMHLTEYGPRAAWPTQRGQVGFQGRSPKARGCIDKNIRKNIFPKLNFEVWKL